MRMLRYPADRENLTVVHRSGLRLLKLVNTLLDFSRVEAGRLQAVYEPTDLATLTTNLTSVFRSAIEKAGLELVVDTPQLPEPVYVDREMWEKIVLNLLSNALKFTLRGRITITQRVVGDHVELAVEDTGVGIPDAELVNVFKRFYRIEGTEGRTHEGTGIGLALVEELVKLHGGTVAVRSTPGQGSTFTVSIPLGAAHLPAERMGVERALSSTGIRADAFVEEALRWLPEGEVAALAPAEVEAETPVAGPKPRVLLADDNADMREYVQRLLSAHYEVAAVADGEAAWSAILQQRPDLLLSDVMMPRLDGFGLLARVRQDAWTRSLPVILLSARAGEESRIEGLQAGADDYLIKPFSARELVARVRTNLEMGRLRQQAIRLEEQHKAEQPLRESEARLRLALESGRMGMWEWDVRSDRSVWNAREYELLGLPAGEGHEQADLFFRHVHPEDAPALRQTLAQVMADGSDWTAEFRILCADGETRWLAATGRLYRDSTGTPLRMIGVNYDITARKAAEQEREQLLSQLQRQAAELTAAFNAFPEGLAVYDAAGVLVFMNPAGERLMGYLQHMRELPDDARAHLAWFAAADGTPLDFDATPFVHALQGERVLPTVTVVHHARADAVALGDGPSPFSCPMARISVRSSPRSISPPSTSCRSASAATSIPWRTTCAPRPPSSTGTCNCCWSCCNPATCSSLSPYRGCAATRPVPHEHHDRRLLSGDAPGGGADHPAHRSARAVPVPARAVTAFRPRTGNRTVSPRFARRPPAGAGRPRPLGDDHAQFAAKCTEILGWCYSTDR